MASIVAYKTKAGTPFYRVRYRKPGTNATASKSGFKRKKDAEVWAAKNTVNISAGCYVDPLKGKTTVSDLHGAWWAKKQVTCKPSYLHTLEGSWNKYVEPKWGNRPIGGITKAEVQEWVGTLATQHENSQGEAEKAKSASVVIRASGILSQILDDATEGFLIPRNVAGNLELPRKVKKKHPYLTAEQLAKLANECGREWGPVVLVLGLVGMRWGELSGIRVEDVDTVRHRMVIWGSATQINSSIAEGTTKSNESRSVVYPRALDEIIERQMLGKKPEDLLFSGTLDGHIRQPKNPKTGHSWFTSACDRAGVPRMTVHDLRHTAASLMVHSGANVRAVSRQLGHKSVAMTLNVYADLFDDDLTLVGDAMSDMLARESVSFSCHLETVKAA
jgi:integrase